MPGRVHSREFKLSVVRQVVTGEKRPARVCLEHQLAESLLLRWREEYVARGEAAFAPPASPTFAVVAIHDPRYREPLLLATPLALPPQAARDLYRDRWPVEQLPLAAKQMLGAARQVVHAPETRQRLPELTLLAGSVLSYAAATQPAVPTGFWDRRPAPTPGRRRRVLARYPFPHDSPLPARLREKAAVTAHLPKGWPGHRRRATSATAAPAPPRRPPPSAEAA